MFKSIKDEAMWILIALALAGCAKTTPTESGFKAVGDSIDALEASLPKECATDGITKQIAALRAHLAS